MQAAVSLPAGLKTRGRRVLDKLLPDSRSDPAVTVAQMTLAESYRRAFAAGHDPHPLRDGGFSVFSQNEEDGILLYIFALIGTTNKVAVEICAGDGIECNVANLLVHHRWVGALFDGSAENVAKARDFYLSQRTTRCWPPQLRHAWITRENVNDVVAEAGISGEIDLLSLDIDGNDYWVWQALSVVRPRVVVLEFNHLWGPDEAVTIPYDPGFVATYNEYGSDYFGASLSAFVALGRRKGYRLVGTNAFAMNAFFISDSVTHAWLREVPARHCFDHPRAQFGICQRFPRVRDMPWEQV